jgi:IS30 family transposase
MREYNQLSLEERLKLAELRQSKTTISEIGVILGRSKSTISREFRRNQSSFGGYWPDTADRMAHNRRHRGCRIDHDEPLKEFVRTQLMCHYWTPEQIAGHLKHKQTSLKSVSHETIYTWLYQKPQREEKLWKFLARHKAKRGLRKSHAAGTSRIPNRVSIHDKPKVGKKVFGHWEGDLMSFLKNSQHILVLREKKTMFTLSLPLPSKTARDTAALVTSLMNKIPPNARKTLILDNGLEFAKHEQWLKELNLPSFFCDPYSPWQKGGVENTNGRLRRDLPRKTDVKSMKKEDFDEVIENYNSTPRKKLKWKTPIELFNKNLNRVALQT